MIFVLVSVFVFVIVIIVFVFVFVFIVVIPRLSGGGGIEGRPTGPPSAFLVVKMRFTEISGNNDSRVTSGKWGVTP